MFKKLLIANRGEIACRIIKTARRLGIKTVAVYSDADTNSSHVSMADEAVYVGPSPSSESYLNIEKIMDAIVTSGADAVHPGYGFLSENREFAKAVEAEGVTFVGPSTHAIKMMGDKIESKTLAIEAGVTTVPGYMGIIKDADEAVVIAKKVGYPVMVKASAGGGGKGMRIVYSEDEVKQAFKSATNEARKSFGDDRIFIEKFIEKPRHIEIQVLADKHGNIVCLGERECSIQRHNQKVIEEAPSCLLDDATRKKMYEECVSLSKTVGYYSAGTVEFIVDSELKFYFLEMNTRLQVEHPVTEYITGLDLVEQMLLIAAGEKLSFKQEDVKLTGWAMESRIYAEDPSRGFLPSSGRISEYKEPEAEKNVRVDSGVYEGGQVSMFYDAMIAKLITYGDDRKQAIENMQTALGKYVIRGVSHNISFLEAVMGHEKFMSGDITTKFIEQEYPEGFFGAELTSQTTKVFLAVAINIYIEDAKRAGTISGQVDGRHRLIGNRWVVNIDRVSYSIFAKEADGGYEIRHESKVMFLESSWILGNRLFHGRLDEKLIDVQIEYFAGGFYLTHAGSKVKISVMSPRVAELEKFLPEPVDRKDSSKVEAPISGVIVEIKVKEGEEVKQGQELFILEAMKMENIICAERDAIVKLVNVSNGDNTSYGDTILEFEEKK